MDLFQNIRALRHQEKSFTAIGKELGIDRKTAAKYAKSNSPPRYKQRLAPTKPDPLKDFEAFIRSQLEVAPDLSGSEIYALIRPRGYTGCERTIQRRLNAWEAGKPKERFFEQQYEPGEQAQFDFKEMVELPFRAGVRIVHLHFGTLPHSGFCGIRGYPHKTYECYMDGIHSFFEKAGGLTENIRFDNLSPCVKKVRKDGGRDYTAAFERAIGYYGFGTLPCSPGKGNEKGDVERDIQTFARRFKNHVRVNNICFEDFAHLNRELNEFVDRERNEKTKDRFMDEQKKLLPLPPRDESVLCKVEDTRASVHGTVRINKTTYSVPDEWIGRECRVVAGAYEVKITLIDYLRGQSIVHPRKSEGEHSIKLEHVIKSLLRKPQAMIRWRHRDILFPELIFRRLYQQLSQQEQAPGGAEREFLRILNLIHHVSLSEIVCGLELILADAEKDLFVQLKELLLIERRPADVIDITYRLEQVPLTPNLKDYDQLIPAASSGGTERI